MKTLLLTTLPNEVADILREIPEIEIIDCLEYTTIETRLRAVLAYFSPDLIITYRCPYILSRDIYALPPFGAYNIHPSLLPAYKGLNPWKEITEKKETCTGVTIHRITGNVDSGDIVIKEAFYINPNEQLDTLRRQSDRVASLLVRQLIDSFQSPNANCFEYSYG